MPNDAPLNKNISVIIPVFNDLENLRRLITQIEQFEVHEIIISDGGGCDKTPTLARENNRIKYISSPKGRGQQISTAVAQAQGDIVWIIHADSILPADCIQQIHSILSDTDVALGCFPIRFEQPHTLLKLYAFLSKFDSRITTFGDQAFFMRRSEYKNLGGCPPIPLFEDVALRKLACKIGKVRKSNSPITTSSRKFLKDGVLKNQISNFLLLTGYFLGLSPKFLARQYYKNTPS